MPRHTTLTLMLLAQVIACGACGRDGSEARASSDEVPAGAPGVADPVASPAPAEASPAPTTGTGLDGLLAGLDQLADAVSGDETPLEPWPLEQPPAGWEEAAPDAIPLTEGLTVVTAVAEPRGDYESMKQVREADESSVLIHYRTRSDDPALPRLEQWRRVSREDLREARGYRMIFGQDDESSYPGQTALGVSTAVLDALRRGDQPEFELTGDADMFASLMGAAFGGDPVPLRGQLQRVEGPPQAVPVLLNGSRVWLPAIHARGTLQGLLSPFPVEFWFLDDSSNPLTLRAHTTSMRLQAVRIDLPAPAAVATELESALASRESAELFGVYFEFASDELQPESDAVLDEVAALLERHPDWRLRVEGHTDDVGRPEDNLDLSERRAAAVVAALAARVPAAVDRLEARGFGETRPRESNETLEGRARNRRVELARVGADALPAPLPDSGRGRSWDRTRIAGLAARRNP